VVESVSLTQTLNTYEYSTKSEKKLWNSPQLFEVDQPTISLSVPVRSKVPNSLTGQVLEAGPDRPLLVDVDDWTRLTWVVRSGLD